METLHSSAWGFLPRAPMGLGEHRGQYKHEDHTACWFWVIEHLVSNPEVLILYKTVEDQHFFLKEGKNLTFYKFW